MRLLSTSGMPMTVVVTDQNNVRRKVALAGGSQVEVEGYGIGGMRRHGAGRAVFLITYLSFPTNAYVGLMVHGASSGAGVISGSCVATTNVLPHTTVGRMNTSPVFIKQGNNSRYIDLQVGDVGCPTISDPYTIVGDLYADLFDESVVVMVDAENMLAWWVPGEMASRPWYDRTDTNVAGCWTNLWGGNATVVCSYDSTNNWTRVDVISRSDDSAYWYWGLSFAVVASVLGYAIKLVRRTGHQAFCGSFWILGLFALWLGGGKCEAKIYFDCYWRVMWYQYYMMNVQLMVEGTYGMLNGLCVMAPSYRGDGGLVSAEYDFSAWFGAGPASFDVLQWFGECPAPESPPDSWSHGDSINPLQDWDRVTLDVDCWTGEIGVFITHGSEPTYRTNYVGQVYWVNTSTNWLMCGQMITDKQGAEWFPYSLFAAGPGRVVSYWETSNIAGTLSFGWTGIGTPSDVPDDFSIELSEVVSEGGPAVHTVRAGTGGGVPLPPPTLTNYDVGSIGTLMGTNISGISNSFNQYMGGSTGLYGLPGGTWTGLSNDLESALVAAPGWSTGLWQMVALRGVVGIGDGKDQVIDMDIRHHWGWIKLCYWIRLVLIGGTFWALVWLVWKEAESMMFSMFGVNQAVSPNAVMTTGGADFLITAQASLSTSALGQLANAAIICAVIATVPTLAIGVVAAFWGPSFATPIGALVKDSSFTGDSAAGWAMLAVNDVYPVWLLFSAVGNYIAWKVLKLPLAMFVLTTVKSAIL